jgi:uncharacterized RDD family membrane protein YckC
MNEPRILPAPAGLRRRLLAFAVDYLAVSLYIGLLLAAGISLYSVGLTRFGDDISPILMDFLAFSVTVLPVTLYFALCESGVSGATIGKRLAHIRVISLNGARVLFGRSLLRSAIKFLPWQIAHTSLFHIPGWPMAVETIPLPSLIGLIVSQGAVVLFALMIAFSKAGRALYDHLAGTVVVSNPMPSHN